MSFELSEVVFGEYLRYQPHVGADVQSVSLGHSDAGALLPAVLESKEAKKGKPSYIYSEGIDSEDTATLTHEKLASTGIIGLCNFEVNLVLCSFADWCRIFFHEFFCSWSGTTTVGVSF